MRHLLLFMVLIAVVFANTGVTQAQSEIGHYAPGVLSIRDFAMPDSGFYGVLYTYAYRTNHLNDAEGNEIDSVTILPGATLDVNVDVNAYVLAPTLIWVSKWKLLGAKYGAYISMPFGNTSVGASLTTATGSGRSAETAQFGLGDLLVQPVWLGWTKEHWNIALGYSFYAPTGKYSTESYLLPVLGESIVVEAADNVGLGFWTHQIQGAASWFPWADQRMAIVNALTYEIHGKKKDFDLKPGQDLSWNWGISQYLPLKKDMTLLLEVGPTGYSSWQISDDSGSDAIDPPVKDQVHGIGGQLGLTYVPWNAVANFHYFYEFASNDRFKGQSIGLNIAFRF